MALTFRRIWDSPTLMTWASFGTNAARFVVVLPLLLNQFTAEDVAVWYLIGAIMQIQSFLDFGFSATGARYFAYAMGGAESLSKPGVGSGKPNHGLMAAVYRALRMVYLPLGILTGLVLAGAGTWMLARPVAASTDPSAAWNAWAIMLIGSTIVFTNLVYSAYLQGTNRVALLRRWETLTNLGSGATMVLAVLYGGGLVALAIAVQAWSVALIFRDAWLAHRTEPETFVRLRQLRRGAGVLGEIWRSAWRSGVGVLLNTGVVRISAGLLAQFVAPATLAAYLLAFNVLDRINQFSMAPFYSKLPTLASLYSQGRWSELRRLAQRGMVITMVVFIGLGTAGAFVLKYLISAMDSDTPFIGLGFWGMMLTALVVHRFGAMTLQLYTLSNHVVWHIIDGIAGAIFLITWLSLVAKFGVYAIPVGLLVAYAGFYTLYSTKRARPFFRNLPKAGEGS